MSSLTIYMKSGNAIHTDGVVEYEYIPGPNGIEHLRIGYSKDATCVLKVSSLDLTQVEAIVEERHD